jgi:hypothetical protein
MMLQLKYWITTLCDPTIEIEESPCGFQFKKRGQKFKNVAIFMATYSRMIKEKSR